MGTLSLTLTPEDVVIIDGCIKIQAIQDGKRCRIYITAPKEIKIDRETRDVKRVNRRGQHPHLIEKTE